MKKRAVLAAAVLSFPLLSGILRASQAPPSTISAALKAEELKPAEGQELPSFDRLTFAGVAGGTWSATLSGKSPSVVLPSIDLKLLVPRIPAVAKGNADLTTIAVIQREFNRNEVHNDIEGNLDFSIANNCLKQGLWEVKLARTGSGSAVAIFHAWFDFPADPYARLFQAVNGVSIDPYEKLFVDYPALNGLPVPLSDLRKVVSEAADLKAAAYTADPLDRLTEQTSKVKLLLSPPASVYSDLCDGGKQPVRTARFSVPGFYNPAEPMAFDLSWLARPEHVVTRQVRSGKGGAPATEIELTFPNGNRILLADSLIGSLPARKERPAREPEVLKLVSGIGTPIIHNSAAERSKELSEDRPRYLLLLDRQGRLVDNHLAGIDGVYLWREAGEPGLLHLWIVGYERIALVAHYSIPWPVSRG
jgi:hypothetical protein